MNLYRPTPRAPQARFWFVTGICLLFSVVFDPQPSVGQAPPLVTVTRLPAGALQPEVVARGNDFFLVYLTGDPSHSDVYFADSRDGGTSYSPPIQVNTKSGEAIAMGTVRGARLAVGPQDRVHVAWNGSGPNAGFFYTRLTPDGSGFAPERNLMTHTCHLDGGGALAADDQGNVYAAWHGHELGRTGESTRQVFLTRSKDGGSTFSSESPAWSQPTGACGCCQLSLDAGQESQVWVIYRSATNDTERDTYILHSTDGGVTFLGSKIDPWHLDACPLSTFAITHAGSEIYAAWETREQIFLSAIAADTTASAIVQAPGRGLRNHPALAINNQGDVLLVWTEGTGWARGGSIGWQVYGPDGKRVPGAGGTSAGIPAWSFPAAAARPDGSFVIYY